MCTVLFGFLVLLTTKSTLKQAINSLMVKVPEHINQAALADKLRQLPGVDSMHDLHVWTMGSKDVLCTAHLMIADKNKSTDVLKSAIKLAQKMGIGHSTFQIEIVGEFDPALETYGIHENPVSPSMAGGSPESGHSHGGEHGHSDSGHSHGGQPCQGHENGHGGHGGEHGGHGGHDHGGHDHGGHDSKCDGHGHGH